MTLHPHHLRAFTALVSLARSWPMVRREAGRVRLHTYDGLRSTLYGRTTTGGHSDGGILDAIGRGREEVRHEIDYWARILDRIAADVVDALWLARACTTLRPARGPLGILAAALPATQPGYARDIAQALHGADSTARTALRLDPDRLPLAGVPCPKCGRRLLQACTTSPHRAAWTVLCGQCSGIWRWTWIAAWDRDRRAAEAEAEKATAEASSSTSTTEAA